jgi:outer membrane protein assembly factor BamA
MFKNLIFPASICKNRTIYFCIFSLLSHFLSAQNEYVQINNVIFKGNKKTHDHILVMEMHLKVGDTISLEKFMTLVGEDEDRLASMGLFTSVKIDVVDWKDASASLSVNVIENLFIYPYPIFELADRNFNVWRNEFNYSIKRTNYGLALTHINFTGHKDKLKVKFQRGYTGKYELYYDFPYVTGRWGLSTNFLYSENKEFGYLSSNNKLLFYKDPDEKVVINQYRASLGGSHRTSTYLTQLLRLEYTQVNVIDTIASTLNPRFLGESNGTRLPFFFINYNLIWNRTVYPLYPTSGYRLELIIRKDGLSNQSLALNNLFSSLDIEYHFPIGKKWILSNRVKGKFYFLNNGIPYFLYGALGYANDVISGYQLKVMDGDNFFINKNALKYRLIDKEYQFRWRMPKQFQKMSVKLYARMSLDYGYVRDPIFGDTNPLSNSHQYGYGPGIDAVLFNNFSLSADYNWIRSGEHGLFFSSGFNF